MKFMLLVKHAEGGGFPPQELMDEIDKLSAEARKAGTLLQSGGLAPMAQSTRVRLSGGKLQVLDGPFAEAKEVVGGYAQFEYSSKEEAVAGAVHFMELHRKYWPEFNGETEIRQIFSQDECGQLRNGSGEAQLSTNTA